MNKPVRVILIDYADSAYRRLNFIVGEQLKSRKENTQEMQLLKSINQKIKLKCLHTEWSTTVQRIIEGKWHCHQCKKLLVKID
jgi:hypothetical protein